MGIIHSLKRRQFLFEELVKRDFRKKYKRTILGMGWSILSPLLTLLVMKLVFTQFFGRTMAHYTIYLFCGNLLFHYYREATSTGMGALTQNAAIFTKINVPKYLFLFSHNVAALINFAINIGIFLIFCLLDRIDFSWKFFLLLYPIGCFLVFNLGIGLVLSALYVFFRDVRYLYDVFTLLLMYLSAIFYSIDKFPALYQKFFLLNPVFVYISYFRTVVLAGEAPELLLHGLCLGYALVAFGIGAWIYKKYNHQFLYYV